MSEASDLFNALPEATRRQIIPDFIESQITQLEREKTRLNKFHAAALVEVNAHIRNLQESLARALHESKRVHHIDGNPCNNDPDNLELR